MKTKIDLERFYSCFINALSVDREDLDMNKSLIIDLGADSIDFLDLIYQLEKVFDIKIPQGELQQKVRKILGETDMNEHGDITKKGIKKLINNIPELDFSRHKEKKLNINDIPLLFTVETFYKITEAQIQSGSSRA